MVHKIVSVFLQIIGIGLATPGKLLKKISIKKTRILFNAIINESPETIVSNFKKYLNNSLPPATSSNPIDLQFSKERWIEKKQEQLRIFIRTGSTLAFSDPEDPDVSIIVVLYNKVELTLACLQSIINIKEIQYQLILVDNQSVDQTELLLGRITGACVIRNSSNLHFLKANNQALARVKGKNILFLNNDTEIEEDALKNALLTLKTVPYCGAVSGKLLQPNGRLQEAGSIVWNDGSCLGYGRNDDPNLPQYNFMRMVDYCSGAFLLTPAKLFREHKGFDPLFEPAYYEETDFCHWLKARGFHVVYNPKIEVRHFEFGSGLSEWAIRLQQVNQIKFFEKHKATLVHHFSPDSSNILKARFASSEKKLNHVLYIDDRVPHLNLGAGFPRSNTIVNLISELGYQVTIYPLNFPNDESWGETYNDINPFIEIAEGWGADRFSQFIGERKGYYQSIWISRPHNMEALLHHLKELKNEAQIIYDAEAIFAQRAIDQLKLSGKSISENEIQKKIKDELKLALIADKVSTVSENDAEIFRSFGKRNVLVLGHQLEIKPDGLPYSGRSGLLFVGNLDYNQSPNVDSLVWFIHEVLPLIRKNIPEIVLDVVGSANAPVMKSLQYKGVHVLGKVDDLSEFYQTRRVFVAPTRYAAGIPYKVHEASSFGLPAVISTVLSGQLSWENLEYALESKCEANEFAEKVIALYNDENIWYRLRNNVLQHIRTDLSMDNYRKTILRILQYDKPSTEAIEG